MSAESNLSTVSTDPQSWSVAEAQPAAAEPRTGRTRRAVSETSGAGGGAGSHGEFARGFARFVDQATRSGSNAGPDSPLTLRRWRELAEAWRISQALRSCGGNRSAAARELGIGRRTLYAKMEKLGIEARW